MFAWILNFAMTVVKNVFLQTAAVMYPAYITKGVLLPFLHHNTVVYLERHKINAEFSHYFLQTIITLFNSVKSILLLKNAYHVLNKVQNVVAMPCP